MNFSSGIHIVFGDAARHVLQNNPGINISEQHIFSFNDDLRMGPINHLNAQTGQTERINWLNQSDFNHLLPELREHETKMKLLKNSLQKDEELFIWCGHTLYDQLATYRLISELDKSIDKVYFLNVPQNYMIKSKFGHLYYPSCLSIMNPEELEQVIDFFEKPDALLLSRWSTLWDDLSNSTEVLRVKDQTGKITQTIPGHFDTRLLSFCTREYTKPALIIAQTLIALEFEANDSFLNWRLKKLVEKGELEHTGKLAQMRDYQVKLPENKSHFETFVKSNS